MELYDLPVCKSFIIVPTHKNNSGIDVVAWQALKIVKKYLSITYDDNHCGRTYQKGNMRKCLLIMVIPLFSCSISLFTFY